MIAGEERLTFAELNEQATRLARVLAGSWNVAKGDRVAIAMRNCPAWIVAYMAVLKAGGIATLINGWWQADEMRHALDLSEPELIIADESRAKLLKAGGCTIPTVALPVALPIDEALAPLLERSARKRICRRSARRTTRPSSSPRARPASPRARSRPTAPSPPASTPTRSG